MFRLLRHPTSKTWRRPFAWLRLPSVALAILGFACSEQPAALDPAERELAVAKGPPAKCNAGTDLSIVFDEGSGGTDALRSDCDDPLMCPYVEGQDNVGAHINDPTGRLMLWPSQYGETTRFVNVTTTDTGETPFPTTDRIYTNGHDTGDGVEDSCGLIDIPPGGAGDAVLEAELTNSDGVGNGIVRFGKDCSGNPVDIVGENERVDITRSADGNTWMISGTIGIHCRKPAGQKKPGSTQVGAAGSFSMTLVNVGS